ncbi:hypothetical protein ASPZODRAFT_139827 [Penicilliopsis zonata CBS 506.65]|uniref:Filamentation protein n=1 Tax=Penicilliopsis zonata CBS 506.65 TaxID=1073090 RepID=A0A1L9SNV2_9EURO|nr:hypothetical protein ASPZODRAFT_139827 [Penicilliopsis zonata CBS 506.65]OJJ48870.1 hypothetical protein ASPZODRAFT_139827 [Penicilliopsis zonata CBS 506.65]
MAGDPEKAQRYIAALNNARCHDRWDEVPELIRKVTKHAPHRKCYIETAAAESKIVAQVKGRPSTARPTSSTPTSSVLSELIPSLLSIIETADGSPQDIFQAQACLAWLHWTLNEPGLALARLPKDYGDTVNSLSTTGGEELSPWTEVCLVRACYIKGEEEVKAGGAAQSILTGPDDSLPTLHSILPWLNGLKQAPSSSPQFSHWSEKLLAKGALLANDSDDVEVALKFFRLWSAHPQVKQGIASNTLPVDTSSDAISRSAVWKSYYSLLTQILQADGTYYPPADGPERPQLASELRRVEAIYESCMMKEVKFPTASSSNSQVEIWVEQVIRNWEVLCSPQWRDEELGEGGQNAVGRNVLDILYRAATKTYHSHLVLRRLFHVHSSLAEFDLAMKAVDSYIEIVTSAKDRAEKAAESGELEDDGTLVKTLSEAIFMLCCFGAEEEAEKTNTLVSTIKKYLSKHVLVDSQTGEQAGIHDDADTIPPSIVALAYRAIGVGLATWANWTCVNESRDDIRAEAIEYLERSIEPELGDQHNCSSLYTLALLLAESRDLDGAIDYVKSALRSTNESSVASQRDLNKTRDLVPLWHLLALLLSAKQDFDIAERSCEAAFEKFPTAVVSQGHHEHRETRSLQNLRENYNAGLKNTIIEQLRGREKERIIETRMTQLAFRELLEGPETALNHSDQLLRLFVTLFGSLDLDSEDRKNAHSDNLVPPKSSAGTVKSFRGSIFGRQKGSRLENRVIESGSDVNAISPAPSSINSRANDSDAPVIQVTDEDLQGSHERPRTAGRSDSTRKLQKRGSVKKSGDPPIFMNGEKGTSTEPLATNGNASDEKKAQDTPSAGDARIAISSTTTSQAQGAKQPLKPIHNGKPDAHSTPTGHPKQPPEQDTRLPTSYRFDSPTAATTRFPAGQAQKHALGVLVKIWLFIAGLYRRASLFEDANEACEEAVKRATRVELLVASQESSAKALSHRGWGVGKSSEELWADVYAERGFLSQAQSHPHEAIEHFEEALTRFPDHPKATVGLANLLLDVWEQKIPSEPAHSTLEFDLSALSLLSEHNKSAHLGEKAATDAQGGILSLPVSSDDEPKYLNRLAARDRAYALLSALTKLGSSWDNSEAWFALARAYEASGQVEKLKEVLWWCVELEDRRPLRHWSNIGSNVYVL